MKITWYRLSNWMLGRSIMPASWTLSYEFRPSLPWHAEIHEVCRFWHALHPEQHRTDFWNLSKEEQVEWGEKCLQEKYKVFTNRFYSHCLWQRFTLTDGDGKTIVLQMDNQGTVKQIQKVKRLVEIEEWVEIH